MALDCSSGKVLKSVDLHSLTLFQLERITRSSTTLLFVDGRTGRLAGLGEEGGG